MLERLLIRGGLVLSMDDAVGDLPRGDVLVEDGRIAAVAPEVAADDAEIIDATNMIVLPGMIDGHKHTWQTIFRASGGDQTLAGFFGEAVPATAPHIQADDLYASNLVGAVDALNAGVTTFVDWCHATLTPEHARAGLAALRDSGARAWFAYGRSLLTWSDRTLGHPEDIATLQREAFTGGDELVRLAMAARGPMFADLEPTRRDFELARSLGIPISVHVDMPGYPGNDVVELARMGVLGPDVALLHGNTLTDEELDLAIAADCRFVDSSELDILMGIGEGITERLHAKGIRPGISADTCVSNGTDLFWVMRALLLLERNRAFAPAFAAGVQPEHSHLPARELLEHATIDGARSVWLEDEIGSLTPGKRADVILVRGDDLNMAPLNDPVAALVFNAGPGNVDTVVVDGRVVKRRGTITSIDPARVVRLASQARDRVYEAAERDGYRPAWRAHHAAGSAV